MSVDLLPLRNRRAAPLEALPTVSTEEFGNAVRDAVHGGWRLLAYYGMPEAPDTRLVAVLADDAVGAMGALSTVTDGTFPSLAADVATAARFELEIAEQCGVTFTGHPFPGALRRHAPDHAAAPAQARVPAGWGDPRARLGGEELHEVAVGPVHAGLIEPGHFRFQAYGETVLRLDVMLGYQHRGVEPLLETLDPGRAMLVAESIAGDTVVGHADAYCGALEALARCRKTPRAQSIRGIALELERLANHVGDLGAIAGDIAYQPAAAYFGRLRGEFLNLLMTVSGNRYGRGLLRPGGTAFDITPEMAAAMRERLAAAEGDIETVMELMLGNATVQARLEGAGVVSHEAAHALGLVGPAARACEVARDVRHDHPWGIFRFAHIPLATAWAGDVMARVLVRRLEIERSLEFVAEQLGALPRAAARVPMSALRPSEIVVAMSEGWRGEIVHVVVTDGAGRVRRHKVIDPSFRNWPALEVALVGQQISDFPLCNKSFNLSYAGHDL